MMIRSAEIEDAPGLVRVRHETWKATYRDIIPDAVLDHMDYNRDLERWQGRLAGQGSEDCVFVAEADGQVVGFCMGGKGRDGDPDYDGELYAIYVLPAFQGGGTGQALAGAAMDWLRQHNYKRMLIWVLRDNPRARRFYEALGGSAVRERQIEIGGAVLPEVGYGVNLWT